MNLTSRITIKNLLKKYQTLPKKRLGQIFLADKRTVQKIIQAAGIEISDTVLEVGPGIGTLTQELAKKAKRVIAVEKDPKMCRILEETLSEFKNVEIIQGDILKSNIGHLTSNIQYKIVANLPFYLTAPVIRKFLEAPPAGGPPAGGPPKEMVLVVQKEVAQRICAKPPRMSILAVSVQLYAEPKIVSYISKKSFWPSPEVDSAILRIAPLINANRRPINTDTFFKIVKAGFSHPRKQILNNFKNELKLSKEQINPWLLQNNIQPTQRAETLTVQDWINLAQTYKL